MWQAHSRLPAVSVKNEANGVTRQTPSGADGKFSVSGLPAGTYSIEVSAPSFATSRRAGLKLAAGSTENISMALNVGELSQTVTVEGAISVAAEMAPSTVTVCESSPTLSAMLMFSVEPAASLVRSGGWWQNWARRPRSNKCRPAGR